MISCRSFLSRSLQLCKMILVQQTPKGPPSLPSHFSHLGRLWLGFGRRMLWSNLGLQKVHMKRSCDRATTVHNLNFSTVTSLPVFSLFPFHPSKSKELLEAATALPWAELSFRCQRSSRARQDVAWALPEWLWIWGPRKQTREEEKQEEIGVKKAPRLKASSIQKHSSEPLTKPTRTRFRKKMSVLKLRVRSTALAPAVRVSCSKNQNPYDSRWDQTKSAILLGPYLWLFSKPHLRSAAAGAPILLYPSHPSPRSPSGSCT